MLQFKKYLVILVSITLLCAGILPYLTNASELKIKSDSNKEVSIREDSSYNLTATPNQECNAILLEWKDVHPGQWYMPYMITSDGPYPLLDYAISETQYLHTERLQNVEYCYYIQAFDVNGVEVGDKSKTVCVTIKCLPPPPSGLCCPQIVEGLFSGKHMQMLNADGSWSGVNVIPWDAANTSSWKNEKVDVLHECGANWIYGAGTWNSPSTITGKKQTYRLKFTIPPGPCTKITIKTFIDDEATYFLQKAGGPKKQVWTKNGTGYYEFDLTYVGSDPENCLSSGRYTLTIEHYDRIQIRYGLIFAADCKECCIETWTGSGATSNCDTPDGSCQLYLSYQIDNINGRKQYSGEAAYQHILQQGGFVQSNGQLYGNITYNTTPKVVQNRTLLPPRDISNWVPGAYIHWKALTKEATILVPKNIPCEDEKDQYAGPWRVAILKIGNNQIRSGELPSFPGGPSALIAYCSQTNDNALLIPSPLSTRLVDPTNQTVVPLIIGGFTMVPLRAITEVTTGSSSNVHWLPQHKIASIWFTTASRCCCVWSDVGKITKITKGNILIGGIDRARKSIIITRSGYTIEFTLCNGETKTYQVTDDFMDESKYATLSEVAGTDICVRLCVGRDPVNPRNAKEMIIKWIICGTNCCDTSGGQNPCPCGSECEWTKCAIIQSVVPSSLANRVTITIKDCATGAIMQLMGDPNLFAINANIVTWGGSPTLIKYQVGMCAKYCIIKSDTIPPYYSIVKWEAIAPTDPCCCSAVECEWTNCVTIQSVVTNGPNLVKITIKDCQTGEIKDIFGDPNLYSINSSSVTWGTPTIAKYEVNKCAKYCLVKDVATAIWKIVKWEAIAPTDPCCCSGNCTWTGKGKVINANQSSSSTLDFDNNCDGIKDITYNINYALIAENPQAYDGILGRYRGCADLCVDPTTNTVIRWKAYPNDPECCPSLPCPECPGNIVKNWGFTEGLIPGTMPAGQSTYWTLAYGSPDIGIEGGCCDRGRVNMWGNKVVGEAIQQSVNFVAGRKYKVSFYGRRQPDWASQPNPGDPPMFAFRASNSQLGSPTDTNGVFIGTSSAVTTADCVLLELPEWTAPANYNTLTVSVTNTLTINDGEKVSKGLIDRICIKEVETCCQVQTSFITELPNGFALCPGDQYTFKYKLTNECQHAIVVTPFKIDANDPITINPSTPFTLAPASDPIGCVKIVEITLTMPNCTVNSPYTFRWNFSKDCGNAEAIKTYTVACKENCNEPECPECPGNIVKNWGFYEGFVPGAMPTGKISDWTLAYGSPDIGAEGGCCDRGRVNMWGNKVGLGEAIQQKINFVAGRKYKVSFYGRRQPDWASQTNPGPAPMFAFRVSNIQLSGPEDTAGVFIGTSSAVTTADCVLLELPEWTAPNNYTILTVSVTNTLTSYNAENVSKGLIDRICITEIATNICCDWDMPYVSGYPSEMCPGEVFEYKPYLVNKCKYDLTFTITNDGNPNVQVKYGTLPWAASYNNLVVPANGGIVYFQVKFVMPPCTPGTSVMFNYSSNLNNPPANASETCKKKPGGSKMLCKNCPTCCDWDMPYVSGYPSEMCPGEVFEYKPYLVNKCKYDLTFTITNDGNPNVQVKYGTLPWAASYNNLVVPANGGIVYFQVKFVMPPCTPGTSVMFNYSSNLNNPPANASETCKRKPGGSKMLCKDCRSCCNWLFRVMPNMKVMKLELCPGEEATISYNEIFNACEKGSNNLNFTITWPTDGKITSISPSTITNLAPQMGTALNIKIKMPPKCEPGQTVSFPFVVDCKECGKKEVNITATCKNCPSCTNVTLKISKFDLRGGWLEGSTIGRSPVSMRILFDVNSKAWGLLAVGKCFEICYEVKTNRSGNYNWGTSIKEVACPANASVGMINAIYKNNFTCLQPIIM